MDYTKCEACWFWALGECSDPDHLEEDGFGKLVDGGCSDFLLYEEGFRRRVGVELRRIGQTQEGENE